MEYNDNKSAEIAYEKTHLLRVFTYPTGPIRGSRWRMRESGIATSQCFYVAVCNKIIRASLRVAGSP